MTEIAGYLADGKEVIVVYTNGVERVVLVCANYEQACDVARRYNFVPVTEGAYIHEPARNSR